MGKYRHKVTGRVREVSDSYARAVSALEPVSGDTAVSPENCGPCGSQTPAGVGYEDSLVDEPTDENDEGEGFSWQS